MLLLTSSLVTHLPTGLPLLTSLGSCLTTKIVKSMSRKKGQCFPQTLLLPGIIFLPPSHKTPSPSRLLPMLAFSELIMHAGRLAQQDTSSLGLSSHCQKPSRSPEILPTSLSSPSQSPKIHMSRFNPEGSPSAPWHLELAQVTRLLP